MAGMIYAIKDSIKVEAIPRSTANCPMCGEKVISKCGEINVWHWAHEAKINCDYFGEHETAWHRDWKKCFAKENTEIIIQNDGKKHIADVCYKGKVLELQNSPISPDQINERENFYKNMIWVFNGYDFFSNFDIRKKEGEYFSFRWKHPRKSIWACNKRVFFDFGFCGFLTNHAYDRNYEYTDYGWDIDLRNYCHEKIFEIKKIYHNTPCGGWGFIKCCDVLVDMFKNEDE